MFQAFTSSLRSVLGIVEAEPDPVLPVSSPVPDDGDPHQELLPNGMPLASPCRKSHPIVNMPDDILCQILLHAAPSMHFSESPVTRYSPWTLSYVCRRWRQLAIGTPAMWSLVWMDSETCESEGALYLLELQLARSKDCDLRVRYGSYTQAPTHSSMYTQHTAVLLKTTRRWRTVTLVDCLQCAAEFAGCEFDRLVELRWQYTTKVENEGGMSTVFKDALHLTHIIFRVDHRDNIILPWSKLLSISLYNPRPADVVQCTSVRDLELDFDILSFQAWQAATPQVIMELPALRRLSLIDNYTMGYHRHPSMRASNSGYTPELWEIYSMAALVAPFFECIVAPLLDTLMLSHVLRYPNIGSNSQITHLAIINPREGTAPNIVTFLHTLPSLTTLHFGVIHGSYGCTHDSYDVVKALNLMRSATENDNNAPLLPCLTDLRLVDALSLDHSDRDTVLDDLFAIVNSRLNNLSCTPLREVVLVGSQVLFEITQDLVAWERKRVIKTLLKKVKIVSTEVEYDERFIFGRGDFINIHM